MTKLTILFLLFIPFLLGAQSAIEYNEKGVEAMDSVDLERAIFFFSKSIELDQDYDIPYFNRGISNLEMRKYPEALFDFGQSVRLTSNDTIAKRAYSQIAYIKRNKIKDQEKALESIDRALKIDFNFTYAHHMRGLILHDMERFEEAIESYNKAAELSPRQATVYYDRGIAKRKLNRLDEAIADYTKAIAIDPASSITYNNRGFAKQKKQDFPGAIADFTEAIKIDNSAYSYNNRGFVKYLLGDNLAAKIDCEKSIEMNPDNSWAYHYLGLIYYELGRKEDACELFMKAVNLGKEDAMLDFREKCTEP